MSRRGSKERGIKQKIEKQGKKERKRSMVRRNWPFNYCKVRKQGGFLQHEMSLVGMQREEIQ